MPFKVLGVQTLALRALAMVPRSSCNNSSTLPYVSLSQKVKLVYRL